MPLLGYEPETRSPEELRALRKQADEEAQTELGPALELVEMGEVATTDDLLNVLSIAERLDSMIDRYFKRLLFVRVPEVAVIFVSGIPGYFRSDNVLRREMWRLEEQQVSVH